MHEQAPPGTATQPGYAQHQPSSPEPGSWDNVRERDPNDPDDLTGTDLAGGRYTLFEIMGRGGMGYVYLAQHNTLQKRVAIKVLASKYCSNEQQVERFVREAQAASKLEHDNVIDIYDFGSTPNRSAFIAMELLKGEDLASTLEREGRLPWSRTKKIILQICRALHVAHSKGVLHRDMKPENCYRIKRRSNKDFIKVLDFGLAKVTGDELNPQQSLTRTGTLFGTPEYMSPEQARGQKVDNRSDIYSVGVMLYEMLTGTVPFHGENFVGTLTQVAVDPPPAPSHVAPEAGITPQLEAVILKSMAKEPGERYQSMREFAEALAAIPVENVTDAVAILPPPPRPDAKNLKTWLTISIAVNVILLVVLAVAALL